MTLQPNNVNNDFGDMDQLPLNQLLKDPNKFPDSSHMDKAKQNAIKNHKRDESRFESLKQDMGEFFVDEVAQDMAGEMLTEIKIENELLKDPNNLPDMSALEKIRNDAKMNHRRDESRLETLRNGFNQYFVPEMSNLMASEVLHEMKIDEAVENATINAFTNHKRRESQALSMKKDLALTFGEEIANHIGDEIVDHFNKSPKDLLQIRLRHLENKLALKDNQIMLLKKEQNDIEKEKINLIQKFNQEIDTLRNYIHIMDKGTKLKNKKQTKN